MKCNYIIIINIFFQLLELYASGKLKPGLNIPVENDKIFINNIVSINLNYYNYKCFWLTGSTKTNGVTASLEWNIKWNYLR